MKSFKKLIALLIIFISISSYSQSYNSSIEIQAFPVNLGNLPSLKTSPDASIFIEQGTSNIFNQDVIVSFYYNLDPEYESACLTLPFGGLECWVSYSGTLMLVSDGLNGNVIEAHYLYTTSNYIPDPDPNANNNRIKTIFHITGVDFQQEHDQHGIVFTGNHGEENVTTNAKSVKMMTGRVFRSTTSGAFSISHLRIFDDGSHQFRGLQIKLEGPSRRQYVLGKKVGSGKISPVIVIIEPLPTGVYSYLFSTINFNPTNFVLRENEDLHLPKYMVISGIIEDNNVKQQICGGEPYTPERHIGILHYQPSPNKINQGKLINIYTPLYSTNTDFGESRCFITSGNGTFDYSLISMFKGANYDLPGIIQFNSLAPNNLTFGLLYNSTSNFFNPRIKDDGNGNIVCTFLNDNVKLNQSRGISFYRFSQVPGNGIFSFTISDNQFSAGFGINSYGDYSTTTGNGNVFVSVGNFNLSSNSSKNIIFQSKVDIQNPTSIECKSQEAFAWEPECIHNSETFPVFASSITPYSNNNTNIRLVLDNNQAFCSNDVSDPFKKSVVFKETEDDEIIVFPNTSNGEFALMLSKELDDVNIEIRDINGKLVVVDFIINGSDATQFDLSDVPKGIYFLKAFNAKYSKTEKLIIK